jgi:hypothetical protein
MRTALLLLLACCAFAHTARAQSKQKPPSTSDADAAPWVLFKSAEGGFEVMMPGKPDAVTWTLDTPQATVVMHSFIAGGTAEYGVVYADYPWQVEGTERVKLFFEGVRDMGVRGINGRLLDFKEEEYEGHPACVYRVEFEGGYNLRNLALVVGRRLYMVTASTYGSRAPSTEISQLFERAADKFINSFKLTARAGAGKAPESR